MDLLFQFLYPILVSYIFFVWQRKGNKLGRTFRKDTKDATYKKRQVYGWCGTEYKYQKISYDDNEKEVRKEICKSEYDKIDVDEKIYS